MGSESEWGLLFKYMDRPGLDGDNKIFSPQFVWLITHISVYHDPLWDELY
jgi:hypothetical protein